MQLVGQLVSELVMWLAGQLYCFEDNTVSYKVTTFSQIPEDRDTKYFRIVNFFPATRRHIPANIYCNIHRRENNQSTNQSVNHPDALNNTTRVVVYGALCEGRDVTTSDVTAFTCTQYFASDHYHHVRVVSIGTFFLTKQCQ